MLRVFFWLFLQGVFAWIPCLLKLRLVLYLCNFLLLANLSFLCYFRLFPTTYLYAKDYKNVNTATENVCFRLQSDFVDKTSALGLCVQTV